MYILVLDLGIDQEEGGADLLTTREIIQEVEEPLRAHDIALLQNATPAPDIAPDLEIVRAHAVALAHDVLDLDIVRDHGGGKIRATQGAQTGIAQEVAPVLGVAPVPEVPQEVHVLGIAPHVDLVRGIAHVIRVRRTKQPQLNQRIPRRSGGNSMKIPVARMQMRIRVTNVIKTMHLYTMMNLLTYATRAVQQSTLF